jgi:hypothetical protein
MNSRNTLAVLYSVLMTLAPPLTLVAQGDRKDKTAVTYEELYDEPYSVNKLFIGFQPLYGELFATNMNAGFGLEATYFYKDKAHFWAHLRKTYSRRFFDFNRELAARTSSVDNTPEIFNYFELGGTYHIRDFETSSKTKMVLYKKSYQGNKWASRVPLHAEVPSKLRKIYGVRVGAIAWNSAAHVNRALQKQGRGLDDLTTENGLGLQTFAGADTRLDVFSNINSMAIALGGSYSRIRNVAVSFDKFEDGVDDGLLTLFFDILYSPVLQIDDVRYHGSVFLSDAIKTTPLGFRLGLDGRFNRTLSWGYGGEIGYRPGIEGRTFYAMFKISFPVFGTNLDYKVESFGK